MEYILRDGVSVIIRKPIVDDAEVIISVISTLQTQSRSGFCIVEEYCNLGIGGTIPNSLRYNDGTFVDEYTMVKFYRLNFYPLKKRMRKGAQL